MKLARLILLAALLVPRVALAQFGPDGFSTHYIQGLPAFLFNAPVAGDYATLTATTGQTITCARASTATVRTSASTIASVASGHCGVADLGLQSDLATTNLALQSGDLSNAAWAHDGTVAGAQGTAPDGTNSLTKLTTATGSRAHQTFTTGATYTASAWFQQVDVSNQNGWISVYCSAAVNITTCTCATASGRACTATNGELSNHGCSAWAQFGSTADRMAVTATCASIPAAGTVDVGFGPGQDPNTIGSVGSILVWGAQVENQPFATSYVPTAGTSAARAADAISATKPASISITGGTYSATVTARLEGTSPSAAFTQQGALGSNSNFAPYIRASWSANTVDASSNSSGPNLSVATTDSQKLSSAKYALVSIAGTGQTCFNGSCGTPVSNGAQPSEPTTIYLGSQPAAAPGLGGWISSACLDSKSTGCPP